MTTGPIICEVRYWLDPDKLDQFEEYGRAWVRLIEKYGGVHYGIFMPRSAPGDTTMSFPERGRSGPDDVAVALFGFPDEQSYQEYRALTSMDPEAADVIGRFIEPPFTAYERLFLRPVSGRL